MGKTIKEEIFVSTFVKCSTVLVKIKVSYRNFSVIKKKKQIMKINITSDLKALLTKKGVNSKQFI